MNIQLNAGVDNYLDEGCGRCPLVGTPDCKVKTWEAELRMLREIILKTELTEDLKWKQPVYTLEGKNVLLMSCFKDFAFVDFFKGALLKDSAGVLVAPTKNSQADRQIRFTSVAQVNKLKDVVKAYIAEAIDVEKSGKQIAYKKTDEFDIPEELQVKFDEDPAFKDAFDALTPGRQRGYLLYFAQPKQSKTRAARIEKFMPKIFEGKGWSDR